MKSNFINAKQYLITTAGRTRMQAASCCRCWATSIYGASCKTSQNGGKRKWKQEEKGNV